MEKPAEGVDGDCVIHYEGEHKECKMVVKLVNGMRDGRAVIVKNGFAYLKLEYQNGKLTGSVERLNRYLMTELKGYLENGIEVGLFEEYDTDGKVAWRGTYRCGRRYSRVVKSEIMRGYYEEKLEETGTLLSISQYDNGLRNKNGRCFEFEGGVVMRECIFENGVKTCVIREYRNGIPLNEDDRIAGNGTYLSVLLDEPNDDSMIVYDIRAAYGFGVVRKDEKCYEVQWSSEGDRVIAVDLICNRISGYNNRELVTIQYHDEVVDLDADGRRWEGGVRDGKPFGNGTLYNSEGRKEYEGFMINQVKVCYGKEYYCDIETVKYAGCYFDDKRFGYGVLYDRSGGVEYGGLWKNNEPYSCEPNSKLIDNHAELLCIPNNAFNSMTSFMSLNYFYTLKQVVIGYSCFRSVRSFSLDGVTGLESIAIESGSFTMVHAEHADMGYQQKGGILQIVNCPKLTTLQIGDWSFVDYHSFVIRQLPALQSLQIGCHCFCGVQSFSLIGLAKEYNE